MILLIEGNLLVVPKVLPECVYRENDFMPKNKNLF